MGGLFLIVISYPELDRLIQHPVRNLARNANDNRFGH